MELKDVGEDALVARLVARLPGGPNVVRGPGDDCAAVRPAPGGSLELLKTDCVIEGVHFLREHRPDRVGWKAMCRAISDVAACGGTPSYALVTIAAPPDTPVAYAEAIYAGVSRAARRYAIGVVGGETSRSPGPIFVSVAMTGHVRPRDFKRRDGGRAGDALFVTGRLGGSLGGRHLTFRPRLDEGRWLARQREVRAMMDLSDGLASDLPRLAAAGGKGFEIDRESVPRNRGCSVDDALRDGEDYELLVAVDARRAEALRARWAKRFPLLGFTRIGRLTAGGSLAGPAGFAHF